MPKRRKPRKRNGHRVLRVAVCGCMGMKRYWGKLNGKKVKPHGQILLIHQGRVSEVAHDSELRQPHRRHHIFFDVLDENGAPFEYWVELWDWNLGEKSLNYPDYQAEVSLGHRPNLPKVLQGITRIIEENISKTELSDWLSRMWPVTQVQKKHRRR